MHMKQKQFLMVSGLIFFGKALLDIWFIASGVEVSLGVNVLPIWILYGSALVSLALAYKSFTLLKR